MKKKSKREKVARGECWAAVDRDNGLFCHESYNVVAAMSTYFWKTNGRKSLSPIRIKWKQVPLPNYVGPSPARSRRKAKP